MRESLPSICFVVPVFSEPCDGANPVPHYLHLAGSLLQHRWKVHALVCPMVQGNEHEIVARFRAIGADVTSLTEVDFPRPILLPGPNQSSLLRVSDQVRYCLAALHRAHRFDLIEFADRGGLGFRPIQGRRAGADFADVELLVKIHGSGPWLRQQQQRRPQSTPDLLEEHGERHAVEQAGHLLTICPSLVKELGRFHWHFQQDIPVVSTAGSADAIAAIYRNLIPSPVLVPSPSLSSPLVTVVITHHNLGDYLEEALASVAAQTYRALEVLVIDDGSTDPASQQVFRLMQGRYPQFRFLNQANMGVGATRTRALEMARGDYFLPMDADNIARPDMVERLVSALERRPELSALSCYFLAFEQTEQIASGQFLYSYRPTGGPHLLAAVKNVYGDGNALFRTRALREVGGFGSERDCAWEDWEAFVKLVHAGHRLDVVPDFLFYYRHRPSSFSRVTNGYGNQQQVLRHFWEIGQLPPGEELLLWNTLAGIMQRLDSLEEENRALRCRLHSRRYRLADKLHKLAGRIRSLFSWL